MSALPIGVEPLRLADGTLINPLNGEKCKPLDEALVSVPNTQELQREVIIARKRLSDLPVPPQQMNMLSAIIGYTLFGLTDKDIVTVLGLSIEQLDRIRTSDDYKRLKTIFVDNIAAADTDSVRSIIAGRSHLAAKKLLELVNSDTESVSLAASKDILDRAGHRPVDVVEHRHQMSGGLEIRYVESKANIIPTLELEKD